MIYIFIDRSCWSSAVAIGELVFVIVCVFFLCTNWSMEAVSVDVGIFSKVKLLLFPMESGGFGEKYT